MLIQSTAGAVFFPRCFHLSNFFRAFISWLPSHILSFAFMVCIVSSFSHFIFSCTGVETRFRRLSCRGLRRDASENCPRGHRAPCIDISHVLTLSFLSISASHHRLILDKPRQRHVTIWRRQRRPWQGTSLLCSWFTHWFTWIVNISPKSKSFLWSFLFSIDCFGENFYYLSIRFNFNIRASNFSEINCTSLWCYSVNLLTRMFRFL